VAFKPGAYSNYYSEKLQLDTTADILRAQISSTDFLWIWSCHPVIMNTHNQITPQTTEFLPISVLILNDF
jgi:hypothetical protein